MPADTDALGQAIAAKEERLVPTDVDLYAHLQRATEYGQEQRELVAFWKGKYESQTTELCRMNRKLWNLHHCLALLKGEPFANAVMAGDVTAMTRCENEAALTRAVATRDARLVDVRQYNEDCRRTADFQR